MVHLVVATYGRKNKNQEAMIAHDNMDEIGVVRHSGQRLVSFPHGSLTSSGIKYGPCIDSLVDEAACCETIPKASKMKKKAINCEIYIN